MFPLSMFVLWSLVCWLVFGWGGLPSAVRTWLTRAFLAAGLLCFAVAPLLNGRYSEDVKLFIFPNPYVVETIERSYTGLAIGVGIIFLALFALARWGDRLPWKTPLGQAFQLTLAVLLLRVYLEKLGVPLDVAVPVGIIWHIVPVGMYFGLRAAETGSLRTLFGWILVYAVGVRLFVVVLMLLVSHFQLGTHFDNSNVTSFTFMGEEHAVEARSWDQYRNLILAPQLSFWMGITLVAGVVFGLPTYWWMSRRGSRTAA